jgi:hypothetical protein
MFWQLLSIFHRSLFVFCCLFFWIVHFDMDVHHCFLKFYNVVNVYHENSEFSFVFLFSHIYYFLCLQLQHHTNYSLKFLPNHWILCSVNPYHMAVNRVEMFCMYFFDIFHCYSVCSHWGGNFPIFHFSHPTWSAMIC